MTRESGAAEPDPDQLELWPQSVFTRGAVVETRTAGQRHARRSRTGGRVAQEDCLWSIKDVGYFLRVPVATIYQWRVRGEGPPAARMGKHLRFEPDVVRAWVREHREGT